MKNLLVLFILSFFASTASGQSLTEKDIMGTWQVVSIVEKGNQPSNAENMIAAYFDLQPDHSFQLRIKNKESQSKNDKSSKNLSWSFDETTQIINLTGDKFNIKVSKNGSKMNFELVETGIILEVLKPV